MKIVIIGATGTIGKEITKLSNHRGNTVIAASRNGEFQVNIDDLQSIEQLFENIPAVDAIICAAGNASFGSLQELSDEQIELGLKSKLMGQVNLVRKGLNKLNPGGIIILTGGIFAHKPWPQTSNIAMVNAGLEGFVRAAALELQDGKRVAIIHPPLVRETAKAMGMETEPWPTAAKVAETYMKTLASESVEIPIFVAGYKPN
jgi:NAD(P)-dependent dehydrogenase (short-subunit alcohol dehydrogenase family)